MSGYRVMGLCSWVGLEKVVFVGKVYLIKLDMLRNESMARGINAFESFMNIA